MEDQPFSELLDEMLKIARASGSGFLLTSRERRRLFGAPEHESLAPSGQSQPDDPRPVQAPSQSARETH